MRISCVEQMLGEGPLAARLTSARAAGFDGIDLRAATLDAPETRRVLADDGLPVGAVYSQIREPGLLSRGAAERAAALDLAVARAEAAAEVGASCLILVPIFGAAKLRAFSPVATLEEQEQSLLLAQLDELGERLATVPITIALEPLNRAETHFLTEPARAAILCAAIGSARIATMVDTYHCAREGQASVAQIAAVGAHLALVHLSDDNRGLPGTGGIDFAPILAALRGRGYAGWCGFECKPGDDEAALAAAVGRMRDLWAAGPSAT